MTKSGLGVVVGRFQIDRLHEGHIKLLQRAEEEHQALLILIGTRKTPPTATNPLSFELRRAMVQAIMPNAIILPLQDCRDDKVWSKRLDEVVNAIMITHGLKTATLHCGRDGFIEHYSGILPSRIWRWDEMEVVCATDRRHLLAEMPNDQSEEFRHGIIYAMQHLPHRHYLTVDIAMVKDLETTPQVLLARKPDEDKWRFPGGFVDQGEVPVMAARRELLEETGLSVEHEMEYVNSYIIKDWRLRDCGPSVTHITNFYMTQYTFGFPTANDDVAELKWAPIVHEQNLNIVDEHWNLFNDLFRRCGKFDKHTYFMKA